MSAQAAEKWVTIKQAAEVINVSIRTIKKNIKNEKYIVKCERTVKGQMAKLISLASLGIQEIPQSKPEPMPAIASLADSNERQRGEAFRRLEILKKWRDYVERSDESASRATETFLKLGLAGEISRSTLYRWNGDYEEHGLLGLVPNWSNGQEKFNDKLFHPAAQLLAKQLFLQQSRVSYAQVYKLVGKKAAIEGWPVPSYATVTRYLRSIPAAARIALREGRKACEDRAVPSVLRTLDGLQAMEIIESDHHQVDVAVADAEGRVFFPWLTIWFDVRARRPLGWILSSTPNSDGINLALYKTIRKYGVPREVHIDNGKDYRAKIFRGEQGRFKAEKTEIKSDLKPSLIDGIYGMLGIKVHWAIPYNAKTKVIERFFRTLRTEFSVWFRGYRGKNTLEKPELLARQWRQADVFPFDAFKLAFEKWIEVEYSENREHQGLGLRTPNQVFAETRGEKRTVSEEELIWLCSQYPRRLKVGKNGLYLFNDWYWSEKLACEHLGENVLVRYAEDNLNRIFVMDERGRFIGMADKRNPGSWKMDADEYRRHMRMKKAVKESIMPYADIAGSLAPADRERLFLGLIHDEGKGLPEAPELPVETPFGPILENDRKDREKAREQEAQGLEWLHQYADTDMKPEPTRRGQAERRIDDFLAGYYKPTGGTNEQ